MKRSIELMAVLAVVMLFGLATSAPAQTPHHVVQPVDAPPVVAPPTMPIHPVGEPPLTSPIVFGAGTVFRPQSSIAMPGDAGVRAHTNLEVFMPQAGRPGPDQQPPFSGYGFETPASIACVYNLVGTTAGCNPNVVTANPTGGSHAIAVVDAYDYPWAGPDLAYWSAQFGIPFKPEQLQVIYATGVQPQPDLTGGWELEAALDIEVTHAMAPNATIYLVEAASNSLSDLVTAVNVATYLVQCGNTTYPYTCSGTPTGVGEVGMSWGGPEFAGETAYDTNFQVTGVVFFAASGDYPGVEYPCASPYVVCVGGTSNARNVNNGNLLNQITWGDGGSGVSAYELQPTYQSSVGNINTPVQQTYRVVPDVSADSNPDTGIWIWDSFGFQYFDQSIAGWIPVGGTSLGNVIWEGIVNRAANFYASSTAELTGLYANRGNPGVFDDITYGYCGPYAGYLATSGWDFCTGLGAPNTYANK